MLPFLFHLPIWKVFARQSGFHPNTDRGCCLSTGLGIVVYPQQRYSFFLLSTHASCLQPCVSQWARSLTPLLLVAWPSCWQKSRPIIIWSGETESSSSLPPHFTLHLWCRYLQSDVGQCGYVSTAPRSRSKVSCPVSLAYIWHKHLFVESWTTRPPFLRVIDPTSSIDRQLSRSAMIRSVSTIVIL